MNQLTLVSCTNDVYHNIIQQQLQLCSILEHWDNKLKLEYNNKKQQLNQSYDAQLNTLLEYDCILFTLICICVLCFLF